MARRAARAPIGISWIVTWPLTAVFAAMVFLSAEGLRQPSRDTSAPAIGGPDWGAHLPERIAAIDAALRKAPLRLPEPVEDERGSGPLRWTHRTYEVALPPAEQAKAETVIEALRAVDPGLEITAESSFDGTDVRIGLDGLLVSTVRFRWQERPKGKPRVVVVVGPLGDDLRVARQVASLEGPVVLAIRPFRPFSRQVAELGRMFEREVLVDLDAPAPPGGPRDAARQLDAALASVPDAVGVAWFGTGGMNLPDDRLLAEITRRKLLLVREGGAGGAAATGASSLPSPTLLAENGGADAVGGQLLALLDKARQDGTAIGVAAPTDASLDAVRRALAEWRTGAVEVVPVSALAMPSGLSVR